MSVTRMKGRIHHLNSMWSISENKALEVFKNDQIQVGILLLNPNSRLPETGFSIHENFHEFAYIIEGEVILGTSSDETLLKAGDFMYNKPGTPHYTKNISSIPAKILWFLLPTKP